MSSRDDETLKDKAQKLDEEMEDIKNQLEEGEISIDRAARRLNHLESKVESALDNYDAAREDLDDLGFLTRRKFDKLYGDLEDMQDIIDEEQRYVGPMITTRDLMKGIVGVATGGALIDYFNVAPSDGSCDVSDTPRNDVDLWGNTREQRYCGTGGGKADGDTGNGNGGGAPTTITETPPPETTTETPTSTSTPTETPFEGIYTGTTYDFSDIDHCLSSDQESRIQEEIGDPENFEYEIFRSRDGYDVNIYTDDSGIWYLDNEGLQCEVRPESEK